MRGKEKMIGFYNYSVILTYIGLVSSVFGITQVFENHMSIAFLCLLLSGICDLFDGKIARSMKNRTEHEKVFGIQIDSLCDLVCFGVFPAVIGYHYNSVYPLRLIASIMIVLGAVIRLGYFNVMEEERQRNTTENRKEYKVMNDRYNDVQLEDILNERLQMYISHMEQKGVQIMDCRVNIDTTDDRGSCTGELEVLLPVTN